MYLAYTLDVSVWVPIEKGPTTQGQLIHPSLLEVPILFSPSLSAH